MDKQWNAAWITDKRFQGLAPINLFHKQYAPVELPEHRPDLQNVPTLFRKAFTLTAPITSAWLNVTADDYYKLWINGRFVGQGPAPSR